MIIKLHSSQFHLPLHCRVRVVRGACTTVPRRQERERIHARTLSFRHEQCRGVRVVSLFKPGEWVTCIFLFIHKAINLSFDWWIPTNILLWHVIMSYVSIICRYSSMKIVSEKFQKCCVRVINKSTGVRHNVHHFVWEWRNDLKRKTLKVFKNWECTDTWLLIAHSRHSYVKVVPRRAALTLTSKLMITLRAWHKINV